MTGITSTFFAGLVCLATCFLFTERAQSAEAGTSQIESGYIEVPNGRLYYEKTGQGAPIVLLHDGLQHRTLWNHQFPSWGNRYTLIRYDRRGYGDSPAATELFSDVDDLLTVFDKLGIDKAVLIGVSAGGRLALDFAAAHQERLTGLVVVSGVVRGMPLTDHFTTRAGRITTAMYGDLKKLSDYYVNEDPYEIWEGNPQVRAELQQLMKGYDNNLPAMFSRLQQAPERPTIEALGEFTVPTLVMIGDRDLPDIHAQAGTISTGIKGAEMVVITNSGHRIPMEQPERFAEAFFSWLSRSKFNQALNTGGVASAVDLFRAEWQRMPEAPALTENRLNALGYQYLLQGKLDDALTLFKLNVEVYPKSANVYDSYGEALLAKGDTTAAVMNYKKSLQLNPGNTNAETVLKGLGKK